MILKKYISIIILLLLAGISYGQSTIYVAPNGSAGNPGTIGSPTTLENAISNISSGGTIYMRGGIYNILSSVLIERGNDGTSGSRTKLFAYNGETPILNFSAQSESSSNRGIILDAAYWHFRDLIIEEAGDNGVLLSGNNNIIEGCIFRRNHDTGLQLSRYNTDYNSISQWPSGNLILNCEAYDNRDSDNEDADGFAAKLTSGTGNIFRGCIAHHNIDDGWDMYTKSDTGPIGAVTLEDCIAHNNGVLTDGSTSGNGDKNGFKLGGEDISVNHILRRCIAFSNGKHGFTYNRNLGTMEVSNCTGYDNAQRNFNFDGGTSVFKNNLSFETGSNDRIIGNSSFPNAFDNDDSWGYTVTSGDFVTLSQGSNADPTGNGFLNLSSSSDLINAGVTTSGITYNGSAPDLGAVEFGGTVPDPDSYTLITYANPSNGGSVTANPAKSSYSDGETVTLTASAASGYTFSGWSGDASGTNSTTSIIMNSNKSVTAVFTEDGGTTDPPVNGDEIHNFTESGLSSSFYNISGNLSDTKGTVNYNGLTLTQCLKIESSTSITFSSAQEGTLTLVFNEGWSGGFVVDGTSYEVSSGIFTIDLAAGSHSLSKDDVANLYYMSLDYDGSTTPTTYTLSASANPSSGGSVSLNPSGGVYDEGTIVTVTANSATDYEFASWSGDASGSGTSYDITMDSDKSVTANFNYTGGSETSVTIQENTTGFCSVDGTVDSDNGGFTGSGFANTDNSNGNGINWTVNAASSGTYTLEWRFANGGSGNRPGNVIVNGSTQVSDLAFNTTGSWTSWSTVSIQVNLNAGFNEIRLEATSGDGLANIDYLEISGASPSATDCDGTEPIFYTLSTSANPSGGGSISLNPSGGTYEAGTVVTVTATAATDYDFSTWSGDASGSNNSYQLTMDSDKSVTANFNFVGVIETSIIIQENTTGFCSVDGSVDSDNGGFTGSGFANTDNSSGNGINWQVEAAATGSYTLEWRFANGGSGNRSANVIVNGSTQTSDLAFNTTGGWTSWATVNTEVNLVAGSNEVRLEASNGDGLANIDYIEVTGVSPVAADCDGGGGNPDTFTLTTNVSPSSGGNVTLSPAGGTYEAGTTVTITANAATDYLFSYWSGDASGSATTYTITMDSDKSATANFTYDDGGNDDVDFSLVGWATQNGGTTGGQGGPSVIVSSGAELQDAIDLGGPRIIYVDGTITSAPDDKINVKDVDNISILGLGAGAEFINVGIKITRASNIIIRNLKIHHVTTGDKDCISIEGPAHHIWVDHCELYNEYDGADKDYYDGLLDSKRDADYITYSWNYLHDSWKTSLNGSSESDDFNRHITYHHNYFRNCHSRLPLWRGGEGHIFNNYYQDVFSTAINSRIGACIRIENNYFENVLNPWVSAYSDELGGGEIIDNILVNSPFEYSDDVNELPSCNANVPYSYSNVLNSASSVPNIVSQYAGVGKLNITARIADAVDARSTLEEKANGFMAFQNYPNPFNDETIFKFRLAERGKVSINLYNTLGERVAVIANDVFERGHNQVSFEKGSLKSGVYIYVIESDQGSFRQQLMIH